MRIMITGGAGFIGSSLAKSLLADGHDITIIDNLSTGDLNNITDILDDIEFINLDLSQEISMKTIDVLLWNTDIVYHLAASIGVKLIQENPVETLNNNTNTNRNLFRLFEKHHIKVIFSSTSEVYGETKHLDGSKETDRLEIFPPTQPRGGYACSKLMSEFQLRSYTFPNVIVRFFNVVGKTQLPDYGHVLPRFIRSVKSDKALTIYGSGEQLRSFCDIRDAVQMLKVLLDDVHNGEIYNIGNANNAVSMNQLAELCITMFESQSGIIHVPLESALGDNVGEIYVRFPNMDKFSKYYECKYDLGHIIEELV